MSGGLIGRDQLTVMVGIALPDESPHHRFIVLNCLAVPRVSSKLIVPNPTISHRRPKRRNSFAIG